MTTTTMAMLVALALVAAVLLATMSVTDSATTRLLNGDYCRGRPGAQRGQCCGGRQDDCSVAMLDTLCYCDDFCDRDDHDDCCPDYWTFCRGHPPIVPPAPLLTCFYNGKYYQVGHKLRFNCNECSCRATSPTNAEMVCEEVGCLIRPDLMRQINAGNYGWKAANYSFFWGRSLDDGYRKRLGACKPESPVMEQKSVRLVTNGETFEADFDARRKWPGRIQPIHDQGDFASSWALSTVDVAADRLAIQSRTRGQGRGRVDVEATTLSAQNLVSCVSNRMKHCESGSTDRAWWHLSVFGVVSDSCYPYTSGTTEAKGACLVARDANAAESRCPNGGRWSEGTVYRTPPAYRVGEHEEDIMMEIKTNGPVQAIIKVKDDFFMYKTGVYRHTRLGNHHDYHHRHPFHAVRIIGWGVDRSQTTSTNYWLCTNSWGPEWGENGYFRIVRGQNECDIEMFVVGVWAASTRTNGGGGGDDNDFMSNHI